MNIVPTLIPISDLQRDSARIVNLAKFSDYPIVIVRNNKPEVAILNIKKLQLMTDKIKDFEEKQLLWELKETENEFKTGKTYFTKDFSELLDD